MPDQGNEVFRRTILVFDQCVGDAWPGCQVFRGKFKRRLESVLTVQCLHKILNGQRQNGFVGARGDQFIGIERQDTENFCEVRGRQFNSAGTHCQLLFAGRVSTTHFLQNFSAQEVHRLPALNLSTSNESVLEEPGMRAGITFWPFNSGNSPEASVSVTSNLSFAGKCRFCPAASSESYTATPSAATFTRIAAVAATAKSSESDFS